MPTRLEFPNVDGIDFTGLAKCRAWLTEHGFSFGFMQRHDPIAVFKGECDIAKWRNLDHRERLLADGTIDPFTTGWRGAAGGAALTLRDAVAPDIDSAHASLDGREDR